MDIEKFNEHMAQRRAAMKRFERTNKFKDGKNRIHILPGWRQNEEFIWYHDFGQHFVKNGASELQAVYMCNKATYDTPCAVCAAMSAANKLVVDDETQKVLAEAASKKVVLVNALMLDSSEPNTPVILEMPVTVYTAIDGLFEQYGPQVFFDLQKGHEIVVTRTGSGKNTKYTATPSLQPGAAVPAAVMTKLHNLDEYVKQHSEERERKAIAAVNSVVGLLAAPSKPSTSTAALAAPAGAPIGAPVGLGTDAAKVPVGAVPAMGEDLDDLLADLPA